MKKYLIPIMAGIGILASLLAVVLILRLGQAEQPQNELVHPLTGKVSVSDVNLEENGMFAAFYDEWAAIDVLNQLSKQGVVIEIAGEDSLVKTADKYVRKLKIPSYKINVVDKKGKVKKTISVNQSPIAVDLEK
jgi:hypothetical protein